MVGKDTINFMWVALVLTGKTARKARKHTRTLSPGLVAIDTFTCTTKRTHFAQSNFLKVRGQRNKIASNRSLNSRWKYSQGCTESNEHQFCHDIIYLLGENTLQHLGSNLQKFTGKKNESQKINWRKMCSAVLSVSRTSFLFSPLLREALQKWRWSQHCFCWAPSWAPPQCLPSVPLVTRDPSKTTTVTASLKAWRTFDKLMTACRIIFGKGKAARWSVTATWMNCSAAPSKTMVFHMHFDSPRNTHYVSTILQFPLNE